MTRARRGVVRTLQFMLERWVQRGALHQLLLMASLVACVAVLGGIAAWALTSNFESLPSAIWWSFLRLTDPGYLGDDEGAILRVVSTVVTVLGYVLFMGSLIAIMTEWLARTIRKLESGLTPIAMENHFVILGWTNRTAEIIKKLVTAAGRLDRFFARRAGPDRLRIVILADEVDAESRHDLRDRLGKDWKEGQIFLRSGSSLQEEHLLRLDLTRAGVVIVPGADFELGGAELNDTRVVKTLLGLDSLFERAAGSSRPHVVAELFDPRKVSIARRSISTRTEVIAGDRLIGRLLSQSLRHPGVAAVLLSLMTHREGNSLYLRAFDELVGRSVRGLTHAFPRALVLGVVSAGEGSPRVVLNPGADVLVQQGDRLILLAEKHDDCRLDESVEATSPSAPTASLPDRSGPAARRFLILGWSYKVPTLLAELSESPVERFEITILSRVSQEDRDLMLEHVQLPENFTLTHAFGNYSLEHDLAELEPHEFDHVVFLASSWMDSSEEADARTVMGLLLLRSLLDGHERDPEVLVELLDSRNATLLGKAADSVFVTPQLLSHLLAHVGLLPELNAVFEELICSGGSEITLRPPAHLGLDPASVSFEEVQRRAVEFGCVGLGFYHASHAGTPRRVQLNPKRGERCSLRKRDRIILLTTD